jgi:hypothetical protein
VDGAVARALRLAHGLAARSKSFKECDREGKMLVNKSQQELAEKIRQEFPNIDETQAQRLIRIFLKHVQDRVNRIGVAEPKQKAKARAEVQSRSA